MFEKNELVSTGSQRYYNNSNEQQEQSKNEVNQLCAKSVSSDNNKPEFIQHSINSYRFQLIPQHHYSDYIEHDEMQEGNSVDERMFSRKLQGAYVLQNSLSKMAAELFIGCWEEIKALCNVQGQRDMKCDGNASESDQVGEQTPQQLNQQNTFLPLIQKHISQKKSQIMQRQKRGFTLDSLEKIKQNKSKSKEIKHLVPAERDFVETKNHYQLNSLPINPFSAKFSYKDHGYTNNVTMTQHNTAPNQIITTVKPIEQQLTNNQDQDIQRLKIIAQISDKLKFSTFRAQNTKSEDPYDIEIIRRLSKLQNIIRQLNLPDKNEEKKDYKQLNDMTPMLKTNNNVSNSPAQKAPISKLLTDISIIRQDINQIKNLSQRNAKEIPSNIIFQSGHNFIPGKSNYYFANQNPRPQVTPYINNNLIQGRAVTPLNNLTVPLPQSKVEQKTEDSSEYKSSLTKSRIYRKVHAIQEPTLIYELQRKQVREQQVRVMVENVRRRRNERGNSHINDLQRALPIRGKHEEREWRMQRNDIKEGQQGNCCVLINY